LIASVVTPGKLCGPSIEARRADQLKAFVTVDLP
jgi:hypothetical protein